MNKHFWILIMLLCLSALHANEKIGGSLDNVDLLIEDIFNVINEGAMNGHRVPVGDFGKLYVRLKPATKARMGRNPITGEEIKIAAKKATKVPKFVFKKAFKEATLKAKIKA